MVKLTNRCRVFQCTVNWARARLRTALYRRWRGGVKGKLSSEMHVWCAEKQSMFFTTVVSEPETFVGESQEGLAIYEAANIFQEGFQMTFGNTGRGGGDMGRDDYVFHLPERVICRQRFDLEDVECGAGDLFLLQSGGEILQINDGTAADVDQVCGRFHLAKLSGAKQFFGLWCMRSSDDDKITDGQEVGQAVDVPDVIDDAGHFAGEGIDGVNSHAERSGAVTDFRADGAGAHDTEGTVGRCRWLRSTSLTCPGPVTKSGLPATPPIGCHSASYCWRM